MTGSQQPTTLGAHFLRGETYFRIWAPAAETVEVVFEHSSQCLSLRARVNGYFEGSCTGAPPGTLYRYRVDQRGPWPDPCSRYQPLGVHGPSMVVDPHRFAWSDERWRGATLRGQILYELHIGTFTPEGTFDAAIERLTYLHDLGITMVEVMPVAECPGRWNWGYDGVQLFAPYHVYGDYEAFKRFVDQAHAHELAVILDVVYNHLGPDGNYLPHFSPHYFSKRYKTDWGEALNFDEAQSNGAREFIIENACYWIQEFHLDGLRLDATQSIFDSSEPHVLAELVRHAREAAGARSIVITAENESQHSEHLLPPDRGGFGLDGMWNDDFHHTASVALRGSRDGYMRDYTGGAQEFISCVKYGFLYQGQRYAWQGKTRGSPLKDVPAYSCITFIDNHDQIANHFVGDRIHERTASQLYRALAMLMLLAPQTPMLFMGQEFAASTRFMFFADHKEELRERVHKGRREFMRQFRAYSDETVQAMVPDPSAEQTFNASKLNWREATEHAADLHFHRDLLHLRRTDPVISDPEGYRIDGATFFDYAFVIRWFARTTDDDRLLVVNLGREIELEVVPEPLLATPRGKRWHLRLSSENTAYGGQGVVCPVEDGGRGRWRLPAQCAVLLIALRAQESDEEIRA
jgi:maltooligosyltrehalose trehalohydrolase